MKEYVAERTDKQDYIIHVVHANFLFIFFFRLYRFSFILIKKTKLVRNNIKIKSLIKKTVKLN